MLRLIDITCLHNIVSFDFQNNVLSETSPTKAVFVERCNPPFLRTAPKAAERSNNAVDVFLEW